MLGRAQTEAQCFLYDEQTSPFISLVSYLVLAVIINLACVTVLCEEVKANDIRDPIYKSYALCSRKEL